MIDKLQDLLPQVLDSLTNGDDEWDSLVINRRKPHTYRMFKHFDGLRVCCHVFDQCDEEDAFAHPHPWPGAFLILSGEYIHTVGFSPDLQSQPTFLYREIVRPFMMYEIVHKQTWHKVQPTVRTHTIMVNGEPWDGHNETRTTKGKDLDRLSYGAMDALKIEFAALLSQYLEVSQWID